MLRIAERVLLAVTPHPRGREWKACEAVGPGRVESRGSPTGPWVTEEAEVKVHSEPVFRQGPLGTVVGGKVDLGSGERAGLEIQNVLLKLTFFLSF